MKSISPFSNYNHSRSMKSISSFSNYNHSRSMKTVSSFSNDNHSRNMKTVSSFSNDNHSRNMKTICSLRQDNNRSYYLLTDLTTKMQNFSTCRIFWNISPQILVDLHWKTFLEGLTSLNIFQ